MWQPRETLEKLLHKATQRKAEIHKGKMKITLVISVLVIFCNSLFSQVPDLASDSVKAKEIKTVFAEYSGGRDMYSSVDLTLYTDSTFSYIYALHTGILVYDEGTYHLNDSIIILCSNGCSLKFLKKKKKGCHFKCELYRMIDDKILLYTHEQEKEHKSYYELYFTLDLE